MASQWFVTLLGRHVAGFRTSGNDAQSLSKTIYRTLNSNGWNAQGVQVNERADVQGYQIDINLSVNWTPNANDLANVIADNVNYYGNWSEWLQKRAVQTGGVTGNLPKTGTDAVTQSIGQSINNLFKGGGMGTYTVKAGDTLGKIAAAHGTTVANLAALNGITNVNLIRVGQVLKVSGTASAPQPTVVTAIDPQTGAVATKPTSNTQTINAKYGGEYKKTDWNQELKTTAEKWGMSVGSLLAIGVLAIVVVTMPRD